MRYLYTLYLERFALLADNSMLRPNHLKFQRRGIHIAEEA